MKTTWQLILSAVLFAGCSKEEMQFLKSPQEMLVSKKWQLVAQTTRVDSLPNLKDDFAALPAYEKDDYFIFKPDSTYEYNDNIITRPDASSKILDAGRWELLNDGKFIQLKSTVFTTKYHPSEIKEFTETKLYLETRYPGDGSVIWKTYKGF